MSEREYLKRASIYENQNDVHSAIIEYKNALMIQPLNYQTRWSLGKLYLKNRQPTLAEKELRKSVGIRTDFIPAEYDLVRSLLLQKKYSDALEELTRISDRGTDEDADYLILEGKCLSGLLRYKEAGERFSAALELQPENTDALIGSASVALDTNDWKLADEIVNRVLTELPDHIEALMLRGDLYRLRGKNKEAISVYSKVIKLDPRNIRSHLSRAEVFMGEGDYDSALIDVDLLKRYVPEYPVSKFLLATVEFKQGNYERSEQMALEVLKVLPNHAPSRLLLAVVQYKSGSYEAALANLELYLHAKPDDVYGRKMLADLSLKVGDTDGAVLALSSLDDASGDAQISRMLSSAYLDKGDAIKAMDVLEKAIERTPLDPKLREKLGVLQVSVGKTDEAIESLEEAVELGADSVGAEILMALQYLQSQQYVKAMEKSDSVVGRVNNSPIGYYLRGLVYSKQGDVREAKENFNLSLGLQSNYIPAVVALAELEVAAGDSAALARRLGGLLDRDKENPRLLAMVARAEIKMGNYHAAIEHLEKSRLIGGATIDVMVQLVSSYIKIGETAKAVAVGGEAHSLFGNDEHILEALGLAKIQDKQFGDAVNLFSTLVSQDANNLRYSYYLAVSRLKLGDRIAAREGFRQVMERDPEFTPARVMLAKMEAEDGNSEKARDIVKSLVRSYPDDPQFNEWLGDIDFSMQDYGGAIESYSKSYFLNIDRGLLVKLFNAMRLDNQSEQGRDLLRNWLTEHDDDVEVRLELAKSLFLDGKYSEAIEHYLAALDVRNNIGAAHNNLAILLFSKNREESLRHAEIARELDPGNPAYEDTYGWILVQSGQVQEGLAVLNKLLAEKPHLRQVRYHLAKGYHLEGDDSRASRELARALREGRFEGDSDARVLLEQIMKATNEDAE